MALSSAVTCHREGFLRLISCRTYVTGFLKWGSKKGKIDIIAAEEEPMYKEEVDEEYQKMVQQKRNKSRLNVQHRNILMEKVPFDQEMHWSHERVRYKRRMLGRYGLEQTKDVINPGACWPTPEDIHAVKEKEEVEYPWTLQELWQEVKERNEKKAEEIRQIQADVERNMKNMGKWRADLEKRVAKKEEAVLAAKKKKDDLMEEIRRHFGFKIDPKDERFQEMQTKMEEEERKRARQAKKEAKRLKILAFIEDSKEEVLKKSEEEKKAESSKPAGEAASNVAEKSDK